MEQQTYQLLSLFDFLFKKYSEYCFRIIDSNDLQNAKCINGSINYTLGESNSMFYYFGNIDEVKHHFDCFNKVNNIKIDYEIHGNNAPIIGALVFTLKNFKRIEELDLNNIPEYEKSIPKISSYQLSKRLERELFPLIIPVLAEIIIEYIMPSIDLLDY